MRRDLGTGSKVPSSRFEQQGRTAPNESRKLLSRLRPKVKELEAKPGRRIDRCALSRPSHHRVHHEKVLPTRDVDRHDHQRSQAQGAVRRNEDSEDVVRSQSCVKIRVRMQAKMNHEFDVSVGRRGDPACPNARADEVERNRALDLGLHGPMVGHENRKAKFSALTSAAEPSLGQQHEKSHERCDAPEPTSASHPCRL